MTNAEARFNNNSLRPRKPEGSLGRTAQDVHLDSQTAPELWPLTISHLYYLYAEAKAILGTSPRQTGWSSKYWTWCFTPSQPLWLYQGDTGWSPPRACRYDLELIRTVDNKLSQSSRSVFHIKENMGAIRKQWKRQWTQNILICRSFILRNTSWKFRVRRGPTACPIKQYW